jgi:hypothetical protein
MEFVDETDPKQTKITLVAQNQEDRNAFSKQAKALIKEFQIRKFLRSQSLAGQLPTRPSSPPDLNDTI